MPQKRLFLLLVICALGSVITVSGDRQRQALDREDTEAWERKVWITGHMHFTNGPGLGRTPAAGKVVAFRRTGRNSQVVAVRADADGRYELFLDTGRYKIIVPGLNAERTGFIDLLAAGQPRYIDVARHPSGIRFDMQLTSPK